MQESIVHEGYVRDMIHNYGLDIRYYKLKLPYPDTFKPILDSNNLSAHAYGEAFVQEWEDPVRMVAYIKTQANSEENLRTMERVMLIAEAKGAKYPLTKKWFLETFPEYKENEVSKEELNSNEASSINIVNKAA